MFQDIPLHLLIAVILHKYLGEWMFDLMANGSPYFTDGSTPQIFLFFLFYPPSTLICVNNIPSLDGCAFLMEKLRSAVSSSSYSAFTGPNRVGGSCYSFDWLLVFSSPQLDAVLTGKRNAREHLRIDSLSKAGNLHDEQNQLMDFSRSFARQNDLIHFLCFPLDVVVFSRRIAGPSVTPASTKSCVPSHADCSRNKRVGVVKAVHALCAFFSFKC